MLAALFSLDGDEKAQLRSIVDNALVAEIVDVGILIGGVKLDTLKAHIPDGFKLPLVIGGIRVDAAKGDDRQAFLVGLLVLGVGIGLWDWGGRRWS